MVIVSMQKVFQARVMDKEQRAPRRDEVQVEPLAFPAGRADGLGHATQLVY